MSGRARAYPWWRSIPTPEQWAQICEVSERFDSRGHRIRTWRDNMLGTILVMDMDAAERIFE